jgi:hypothetical protein
MEADFSVKYEGLYADRNMLPAHDGALSIQGIARSLTLVTTYLATGKVKKRAPFDSPIALFLKPARTGSYDTLYHLVSDPGLQLLLTDVSVNLTSQLIYDAVKFVFNRVVGNATSPQSLPIRQLVATKGGDIAALEDAVEPSLVNAHRVIGKGSNNIYIFGDNNQITFNSATKSYITESLESEEIDTKEVSIASYNANSKMGRVYDFEFDRTIPFVLSAQAGQSSAVAIARSLTQYVGGAESRVQITYQKIYAPDGKVKKYIIKRAVRAARGA